MKNILLYSLLPLILFGCRELVQNDKSLRSLGDYDNEKIKTFLLEELESDYKNPVLYFRLGETYKRDNKLPEALNYIEEAIKYAPENTEYYKSIIPLFIELEKWKEAESYSDRLIKLSPSFYHAYYYLVKSCVEQNKMDKAGKNLRILSQINAGYGDLAFLKGQFYLANNDTIDAIYTFEKSIEQGQRVNELVFILAEIYLAKNDQEKAEEILKQHAVNPALDQIKLNKTQGQLAENKKDPKLAIHHYKEVFTHGKDCFSGYKLVEHYLTKWKLDSANYFLEKNATCDKDRDYHFYKGLINYRYRNYEEAVKSYKLAKELAPDDRTVKWRYKQAYEKLYPPAPVVTDTTVTTENTTENNNDNTLPVE